MSARVLMRISNKISTSSKRHFSLHKLSEEHILLQRTCRDFAERELKPVAKVLDEKSEFPSEQIKKLGALGLLAISIPQKYGGSGYDSLALSVAVEEIARGCGGTGSIVSIHNMLYVNLVNKYGNEEQKHSFLMPFTDGTLGCFALSEPDAGTDVSAITTTAVIDGDKYVLNGTKSWVTNAKFGKAAVVFATVDKNLKHKGITAFLVPLSTEGITLGKLDDKLGIRASPTCNLTLENVEIPKGNVIGGVGNGFKVAMEQLDGGRIGIASQALGIAQAALELAVQYSEQRKAFGQPINKLQAVKLKLGEMALRLEAARLLVWRAAVLFDQSERSTKESSMAKLAASEAATFVTHSAIQILGGMGYVKDMAAERHYRDARITEIYAGVNDLQRMLVGDMIIREYL